MYISLNGEKREVAEGRSLVDLLDELGLAERRLAVEVNEEIVPRSQYKSLSLNDGDRVEVVHAIGGG